MPEQSGQGQQGGQGGDAGQSDGQQSTETQAQGGQGGGQNDDDGPVDRKAHARVQSEAKNLRDTNKALKAKADKWDEHEKSQQSETQRWESEKSELTSRATAAELKVAQYDAAAEAGLDLKMARRIQGGTPEEMLADAKELAETFGKAEQNGATQQRQQTRQQRQRPDPGQANGGSTERQNAALNDDGLTRALEAAVGVQRQ